MLLSCVSGQMLTCHSQWQWMCRNVIIIVLSEMLLSCVSGQMLTCPSQWQWMCRNGECIALYDLCNGIAQCSDGSDEIDCDKRQWNYNSMDAPNEAQMKSVIHPEMDKINSIKPNITTSVVQVTISYQWLIAMISILFFILLVIIIVRCQRRRNNRIRNNRSYGVRKSLKMTQNESDEDDLLIGSLYT